MSIEDLEAELLKLSARERARLARRLLESLEGNADFEDEWLTEVARRYEELSAGEVEGIPADEAIRKARERLG